MEIQDTTEAPAQAEDLARRLAEKVRLAYGEGASIERLVLIASVTEEDGAQRAVVEANGLPLYERAGTLRHALNALTSEAT
jgi:hypothetical protein